jgi:hypothetical protein
VLFFWLLLAWPLGAYVVVVPVRQSHKMLSSLPWHQLHTASNHPDILRVLAARRSAVHPTVWLYKLPAVFRPTFGEYCVEVVVLGAKRLAKESRRATARFSCAKQGAAWFG